MYVYLAPNSKVPRFKAETAKVLPEDRRSILPRPYAVGLPYGTCVKLYAFRWKGKSMATTEGAVRARAVPSFTVSAVPLDGDPGGVQSQLLQHYGLGCLGDHRVWRRRGGLENRAGLSGVRRSEPARSRSPSLSDGGLPGSVNTKRVPHGVFFTVNGQVHGSLALRLRLAPAEV